MKKKILTFVCAITMVVGMTLGASAANSVTSSDVLVSTDDNANGQQITVETLETFAKEATLETTVEGATITTVPVEAAKTLITEAQKEVGKSTFIAGMYDLNVPEGTGAASFTLGCSNVWAGQNIIILHQKADGTVERIKPDKVEDNKVSFTLTSYSPIAIVIDTGVSPKTGDVAAAMLALAAVSGLGAAVCGKKAKKN